MRYINMSRRLTTFLNAVLFPFALCAAELSIEQTESGPQLVWSSERGLVYSIETSSNLTYWANSGFSEEGNGAEMLTAAVVGQCMFFRLTSRYQNDEEGAVHDMLTPEYYNSASNAPFREMLNEFIFFSQKESFHHPLQNGTNDLPVIHIPSSGAFGSDKTNPQGIVVESHPATDMYVGNMQTEVHLYAAYDGIVTTARDLAKYRQAVYLTKTVTNEAGNVIGKLVTLYGHVDLDLDEAGGLFMNDQTVQAGDLISEHLYSDTMGGPHLHFEIRYYRPGETGNEEFYGFSYSEPSAGPWTYGTWDPNTGYGFGDPRNHGLPL